MSRTTVPLSVFVDVRNENDDLRRQINDLRKEIKELSECKDLRTRKRRSVELRGLTETEKHIVNVIAGRAPGVASLNHIAEGWPASKEPTRATIMVLISRLRKKLKALEVTVNNRQGQGYWMSIQDAAAVLS